MYKYETHLHTSPVSKCAASTVHQQLDFYKNAGYDGVFITNHFLDGNINISPEKTYEEKINFYFSDYEEGVKYGKEIGIKVFLGVEMSYMGTDFLVYGLDKEWFLKNPQIMDMTRTQELSFLAEAGALIIQAHPYREASYIDHIRLFPRHIHGVEIINACRTEDENKMAEIYARHYNLIKFAGSDNHNTSMRTLAGMASDSPVANEADFIQAVKNNEMKVFSFAL